MSDYVHLVGADLVNTAASTISNAAHEMNRAVSNLSEVLAAHERFLTQWLEDFKRALAPPPSPEKES